MLRLPIQMIPPQAQYLDGTYEGEAEGFGGTITVQVTVEGGQMTDLCHFIRGWRRQRCICPMQKHIIPKDSGGTVCRCRHDQRSNIQLHRYQKCGTAEALEKAEK